MNNRFEEVPTGPRDVAELQQPWRQEKICESTRKRLSARRAAASWRRWPPRAGLLPDQLAGGTFTIANGGVYGSLMSTPILTPPQSAILGMHKIEDRAVAVDGQVVIHR